MPNFEVLPADYTEELLHTTDDIEPDLYLSPTDSKSQYVGLGNTFVARTLLNPSNESSRVVTTVVVDGSRVATINESGTLDVPGELFSNPEHLLGLFHRSISRQKRFRELGVLPIFAPSNGYDLDDQTTTQERNLARSTLAELLKRDASILVDNLQPAVQEAKRAAKAVGPKYAIRIDGTYFTVSDAFADEDERPTVVLHPVPGNHAPTLFYRSNSHASWRALFAKTASGWYAKGMFDIETSGDAPLELQKYYTKLWDNRSSITADPKTVDYAKLLLPDTQNLGDERTSGEAALKYSQAVMDSAGSNKLEDLYYGEGQKKTPHGRWFSDLYRPDFSKVRDTWTFETPMYGSITVNVYDSVSGDVRYGVYEIERDGKKRFWIGAADFVSHKDRPGPITHVGLREWIPIMHKDAFTPPIDYASDHDTYAGISDKKTDFEVYVTRALAAKKRRKI